MWYLWNWRIIKEAKFTLVLSADLTPTLAILTTHPLKQVKLVVMRCHQCSNRELLTSYGFNQSVRSQIIFCLCKNSRFVLVRNYLFKSLHGTTDPQPKFRTAFYNRRSQNFWWNKLMFSFVVWHKMFKGWSSVCAGFILRLCQRMKCFASITSAS